MQHFNRKYLSGLVLSGLASMVAAQSPLEAAGSNEEPSWQDSSLSKVVDQSNSEEHPAVQGELNLSCCSDGGPIGTAILQAALLIPTLVDHKDSHTDLPRLTDMKKPPRVAGNPGWAPGARRPNDVLAPLSLLQKSSMPLSSAVLSSTFAPLLSSSLLPVNLSSLPSLPIGSSSNVGLTSLAGALALPSLSSASSLALRSLSAIAASSSLLGFLPSWISLALNLSLLSSTLPSASSSLIGGVTPLPVLPH